MARNFETMPEEQLRQERAERRSVEKVPAVTPEQAFIKEAAVALEEVQEQLEDEVRAGAAAAPGAAAPGAAAPGAAALGAAAPGAAVPGAAAPGAAAPGAEGQEQAAARAVAAKRKMTAQVTKWATRLRVAAKVRG
jgi:hypothetical protein